MKSSGLDERQFNMVHDTVLIYRKLMNAMAKPGTIENISAFADKLPLQPAENRVAFALALTLLDTEVNFTIYMVDGRSLENAIKQHTFCRFSDTDNANYIFMDGNINEAELYDILARVNCGTHVQPELGTTLLIRVDKISAACDGTSVLWLSGPGVKDITGCKVEGLSQTLLDERKRLNAEYPVGIDMLLFDKYGNFLAIPRTTSIKEVPDIRACNSRDGN